MRKPRVPKSVLNALTFALNHADVNRPECGVAKEHKDAMRLYLDTWVMWPIAMVRDYLNGNITAEELTRQLGSIATDGR